MFQSFDVLLELYRLLFTAVPPGTPGRPIAIWVEGTLVTLQWTPPDDSSGFSITGYVIKFGVVGSNTDDYDIERVDNVITSHEFSEKLEPKTSYQFAVAAVNQAAGQGPWSDFSECVHTKTGKYKCKCLRGEGLVWLIGAVVC